MSSRLLATLTAAAAVTTAVLVAPASAAPQSSAQSSVQSSVQSSAPASERERWDTRVFAKVQRPGYPAFVYAHPNRRLYGGTYTNPQGDSQRSRVYEWTRNGTLNRSWTVPGQHLDEDHGVQVATSDASGRLVLLEKSTSRIMRLDTRTGRFTSYSRIRDLPTCSTGAQPCSPSLQDGPAIPNFAAWGPRGQLFVTDYGQAVIWKVPPGGGKARPWYTDARLDGGQFGTTGLLLAPGRKALLIAQQTERQSATPTQGHLYKLPIGRVKGKELEVLWTSLPSDLPDGFGIGRSGRIYLSNAGLTNQLVVLSPEGEELERFPETPGTGENGSEIPFDTPSSATFLGRRVMVANQSFTGNRDHHAVLDVYVGERGKRVFIPRNAGR